ncbi:MAG: hypothetical protein GXO14_06670 [Thermococci archaeon]|nr:hypothetical protein [Thermococci archaeon]
MDVSMSGVLGDIGIWGFVGLVTGYAIKKLLKIVAVLIGAYIASLFWLQSKGVITINTQKLYNLTGNLANQGISLGQKIMGMLPGTGAFVAGFYVGFKKG